MAKPLISLCGTMYNNIKTIDECIGNLSKALDGLDYEIVIVDNYSNDGSFEILNNYVQKLPIKIYRYKCSRGMGRTIAFKKSEGDYIVTIDLDTMYNPRILRTVIEGYLNSRFKGKKCLSWPSMHNTPYSEGTEIYPRHILERVGGWRDLNRAEDNDLLARLHSKNLIITLPVEGATNERIGSPRSFFTLFFREIRYAEGIISQFRRLFRSSRDMVCGNAYTLKKTVITFRYANQQSLLKTLFMCIHNLFFTMVCKASGMHFNSIDPDLSNGLYIIYKGLVNVVSPLEFGLEPRDIVPYDVNESPILQFLVRRYPETIEAINKIKKWKEGVN